MADFNDGTIRTRDDLERFESEMTLDQQEESGEFNSNNDKLKFTISFQHEGINNKELSLKSLALIMNQQNETIAAQIILIMR